MSFLGLGAQMMGVPITDMILERTINRVIESRLGIFEDWRAKWFAKKSYGKELLEDLEIRDYLKKTLNDFSIITHL